MEKVLRSNKFALFLAVFMALMLWLFVTGDKITRTTPTRITWEVPLRVENLDPEQVVTDIPANVNIILEGLPEDFEDLTLEEIDAFVDLNGREPGNYLIRVQGEPPRGLSLILIEPEQVRVSIETYMAMDFEVEVEMIGEPAIGWQLVEYSVVPEEVLIGAPQSIFERVANVTLLIDITGMRLIESVELSPLAYDEEGMRIYDLTIDPNLITARLEFERIIEPEEENNSTE